MQIKYILTFTLLTLVMGCFATTPTDSVTIDNVPSCVQTHFDYSRYVSHPSLDMQLPQPIGEKKSYRFMDDVTFVGVPLFVTGIIAKSEKKSFRQDYTNAHASTRLINYNFHTEIDNYTQFAPLLLTTGLKIGGVEGRSSWGRYLASGAMAYVIMAGIVNPIKYSAKEMRPDGSTRNSWPSGHTATAFVSATILHKEYGLTRSPWYSIAGYGVATATGVMRVLNNRHWVSDVLSGAGIGIMSTELAYGLSDLIFRDKGIKRTDLATDGNIIENPSFFDISMGIGLGSKSLDFSSNELFFGTSGDDEVLGADSPISLDFQASTVVGAESAIFFNKYIGVGGRLRVKSSPIKGWTQVKSKEDGNINDLLKDVAGTEMDGVVKQGLLTIESDHITEFSADLGVYFNLPLTKRLALGSKLLVGRSIIQNLEIDGHFTGDALICYDQNGKEQQKWDFTPCTFTTKERGTGETRPYDTTWKYITLSGNNTFKYGTGISLTYAYKSSFSWRVFADYDFTRKKYTLTYDPLHFYKAAAPALFNGLYSSDEEALFSQTIKKPMHSVVLGAAFCVTF